MAALNFPTNAQNGTTYIDDFGKVWLYNGTHWSVQSTIPFASTSSPGLVSDALQTFGGLKEFANGLKSQNYFTGLNGYFGGSTDVFTYNGNTGQIYFGISKGNLNNYFTGLVVLQKQNPVLGGANLYGDLVFYTQAEPSNSTEKMRIDGAGQVTIKNDLQIDGFLTLPNNPLAVSYGGTGTSSFTTGKVLVSHPNNSSSPINTASALSYSNNDTHLIITAQNGVATPLKLVGGATSNIFEIITSGSNTIKVLPSGETIFGDRININLNNGLGFYSNTGTSRISYFKAGNQSTDFTYILPTIVPLTDQVLSISSINGTEYTLQWSNVANTAGSITSVSIVVPAFLNVNPSTITSAGTFTIGLNNQNQKKFFAGPISGVDAQPTFRVIESTDIPAITSGTSILAGDNAGKFHNVNVLDTLSYSSYNLGINTNVVATSDNNLVLTNKTISGTSNTLEVRLDAADTIGILPVSKGGTSTSIFEINNLLLGNGTDKFQEIIGNTSNILIINDSLIPNFIDVTGDVHINSFGTTTIQNGVVTNTKLQNSNITINDTTVALGQTTTITATATYALSSSLGVVINSSAGSFYNGATTATISVDTNFVATSSNNMTFTNKTWNSNIIESLYGGTGTSNFAVGKLIASNANSVNGPLRVADAISYSNQVTNVEIKATDTSVLALKVIGTSNANIVEFATPSNIAYYLDKDGHSYFGNKIKIDLSQGLGIYHSSSTSFLSYLNTGVQTENIKYILPTTAPSLSQILYISGTSNSEYQMSWANLSSFNVGTVTSVGLVVPSIMNVSTSIINTGGTFTISLVNQSINTVFAGPGSGSAGVPSFRSLVSNDIPSLAASKITSGIFALARGGTNASSFTAGSLVAANTTATALVSITKGTTNSWLYSTGTATFNTPAWSNATLATTYIQGQILYASLNDTVTGLNIAAISGSILQSNGTVPVWNSILQVANGGTGSNNGSITGTGDLIFTAGGTDNDISLIPSGTTGVIDVNTKFIANVKTPIFDHHAANKGYVDAQSQGLIVKESVRVATTANLSATYSNGSAGIGATLTNNTTQIAIAIDGTNLNINDRVLVKNQDAGLQNGIYSVTTVGTTAVDWVLTRTTDADTTEEVSSGMFVFVRQGSSNTGTGWVLTTTGTIQVGTTSLVFSQFSGAGSYLAESPIYLDGNTFKLTTPLAINFGGTGQVTKEAAFNALSPITTKGDLIVGSGATSAIRLSGNLNTTKYFLSQIGTGSAVDITDWSLVSKTDVGLSDVENIAISTWPGSSNITNVGIVTSGTWQAGIVTSAYGGTGKDYSTSSGILKFVSGESELITAPVGDLVGTSDAQILINKIINLNSNSLSGTLSEFNSALTDENFVSISGIETVSNKTFTSPIINNATLNTSIINQSGISIYGTANSNYGTTLIVASSASSFYNTLTLPSANGTFALTSDIANGILNLDVSGNGLNGSASFTANTSSNITFTVNSNATSSNVVSTIVYRDTSGNFSANNITADITGNVSGTASNVTGIVATVNGGTGQNFSSSSGIIVLNSGNSSLVAAPSGAIVGTSDTQLLLNKSLVDSSTFIIDDVDTTKRIQFAINASHATNTLYTVTFKNASGTMAYTSDIPTVNNGTLSIVTATSSLDNNTLVTLNLSGAYSANTSNNRTLNAVAGPVLNNLLSTMNSAGSGFLRKSGQNTYSLDTNTYLTTAVSSISAGYGLTGGTITTTGTIAIDTTVVVDINTIQSVQNKTLLDTKIDYASGLNFKDNSTGLTKLTVGASQSNITITLPAVTGTLVGTGDSGTVTNTMLAGSIANNKLINSSLTINNVSVSLGGNITITAATTESLSAGSGITISTGNSFNGSVAKTILVDTSVVATNSNIITLSNKTLTSPVLNNPVVNSIYDFIGTTLTTTSITADQVLHTVDKSAYLTLKYLVQIFQQGGAFHVVEIVLVSDGTNIKISEYGKIVSSIPLSSFDADISGNNLRLLVTPTSATSTEYRVAVTAIRKGAYP